MIIADEKVIEVIDNEMIKLIDGNRLIYTKFPPPSPAYSLHRVCVHLIKTTQQYENPSVQL